jgi:hypothetical protein
LEVVGGTQTIAIVRVLNHGIAGVALDHLVENIKVLGKADEIFGILRCAVYLLSGYEHPEMRRWRVNRVDFSYLFC